MSDVDDDKRPTATATVLTEHGLTILRLTGELDLATVNDLQETVAALVDRAPEHLIVDLSDVTFMDSSGIALLLQVSQRLPRTELRNPSPLIRRVLDLTALTEILPVVS